MEREAISPSCASDNLAELAQQFGRLDDIPWVSRVFERVLDQHLEHGEVIQDWLDRYRSGNRNVKNLEVYSVRYDVRQSDMDLVHTLKECDVSELGRLHILAKRRGWVSGAGVICTDKFTKKYNRMTAQALEGVSGDEWVTYINGRGGKGTFCRVSLVGLKKKMSSNKKHIPVAQEKAITTTTTEKPYSTRQKTMDEFPKKPRPNTTRLLPTTHTATRRLVQRSITLFKRKT